MSTQQFCVLYQVCPKICILLPVRTQNGKRNDRVRVISCIPPIYPGIEPSAFPITICSFSNVVDVCVSQSLLCVFRANDVPHGSFQLIPGGQSVVVNRTLVNAGVSAGRYIQLSVLRQLGLIGNVTVSINITFAEVRQAMICDEL